MYISTSFSCVLVSEFFLHPPASWTCSNDTQTRAVSIYTRDISGGCLLHGLGQAVHDKFLPFTLDVKPARVDTSVLLIHHADFVNSVPPLT